MCFLKQPYGVRTGIKLKQKIRTLQLHYLFCFYLMSEDVRTKTTKFDTHICPFLLGTVSGSGTGPLDYVATGPVPDP